MNNPDIKQLFKFYGIEYDEHCYDLDLYIANLKQLINIQAQQIERLQNRLRVSTIIVGMFCIILAIVFGLGGWLSF